MKANHINVLIALLFTTIVPAKVYPAVVLQYHHIDDRTPPSTSTSPQLFREHLRYLKNNQFTVISIPELINLIQQKKEIDTKLVAITFDDGYQSTYDTAFPMLKEYEFPFTVFVNTAPIEESRNSHVTWKQLSEMKKYGATIANHTHNHSHLVRHNQSSVQWRNSVIEEVKQAQQIINKRLKQDVKLFAYPYGEFDEETIQLMSELGYISFGQHSGAIGLNSNLQYLPRFPASNQFGQFPQLAVKLNSIAFENISIEPSHATLDIKNDNPPTLSIYGNQTTLDRINCFGSSIGKLTIRSMSSSRLEVTTSEPFMTRRFRYNCTAKLEGENRYQWFSVPWIIPDIQEN